MSGSLESASATPHPRRLDPFLLLPLITSAVLLLAGNEDFGFDPPGWLDPFMYFGYFWHYADHAPEIDHDYKASRLPWILPGYLIHALAAPTAASYVLVFATLSAGGLAMYVLVRDITRDRTAAAVLAVAWTSCTWGHGVGGWNYHMLAAADYFLVASWLAFRTARSHSTSSAVMTGVCAAAAVHTHLLFAAFLPLVGLTYWSGLAPGASVLPCASHDGWRGVAGALGITFALAVVNVATGGDWLFFMPQVARARHLMRHDDWWLKAATWLPSATYLVMPAVFMITGVATMLRSGERRPNRPARVLVLQAWLAFGIMCVAQFLRQQATLDHGYLAFPLYVYAFPCGGVVLARWPSRATAAATVAASALTIIGPLLLLMPTILPREMNTAAAAVADWGTAVVLPPLVFAGIGGAAMIVARHARLLVFAVWFGALNAWIAPAPTAYGIHTHGYQRQMLELFREADGFTAAFDPSLQGIKYWFADEHVITRGGDLSLEWVFNSYVSTRMWQPNLLGRDGGVPLSQLTLEHLQRAVCVGLLASPGTSERIGAELQEHFASLGRPLRRVTVRQFTRPDLAFDLMLLEPADVPDRRGPPCRQR